MSGKATFSKHVTIENLAISVLMLDLFNPFFKKSNLQMVSEDYEYVHVSSSEMIQRKICNKKNQFCSEMRSQKDVFFKDIPFKLKHRFSGPAIFIFGGIFVFGE